MSAIKDLLVVVVGGAEYNTRRRSHPGLRTTVTLKIALLTYPLTSPQKTTHPKCNIATRSDTAEWLTLSL